MKPDPDARRRLLALAACAALGASGGIRVARAQSPQRDAAPARLVVLMLRGAADGLSMVAPHGEPAYYAARPLIAIPPPGAPDGLLPLDSLFGLHPALAPLMPYWERRQLAFVHASGSHDPTRSHFDAQDHMESGTPGRKTTPDGWLNRLAAVLSGPQAAPTSQRLQAVNLGPTMPRIFAGAAPVASLASGRAATTRGPGDQPQLVDAFNELYAGDDALSRTVRLSLQTRAEILNELVSDDPAADRGSLPLAGLVADVERLGRLMARDRRVRLAFVPIGGWDTHASQGASKGPLANRFALLGRSVDALIQALGDAWADTCVLILSEFGRTVKQNGTNGTDHGHGNVACVIGPRIRGGRVLGAWPGLDAAALHEGRDLAVTTDFRDIVADLLEQRFRLDDAQLERVLPGLRARRRVGLVA